MPSSVGHTAGLQVSREPHVILVVDDEPLVRRTLARGLQREGYETLEAADGEQALRLLQAEPVDLLITDVRMPGKSGIELLETLRRDRPHVPVILITGMPSVEAAVECMKTGAFDYISKPVKPADLRDRVKAALVQQADAGPASAGGAAPGEVLGRYRVLRVLGEGNIGVVCHVETRAGEQRQEYALKMLKIGALRGSRREVMLQRFLHEAEAAAKISHPNVVKFIEYGLARDGTLPYMVMEYFPYPTLADVLERVLRSSYDERTEIIRKVASGLSAIHDQRIYHRDVKPANILFDPQHKRVKITDFGVAQLPESDLTITTHLMGSPAYMAPEAFVSPRVDERADIFSLGVVAYELFLGRRPFPAQTLPLLSQQVPTLRPTEPRKQDPGFPPELQLILAKMLKKKPQQRYACADELVDDLSSFLRRDSVKAGVWERVVGAIAPDWS